LVNFKTTELAIPVALLWLINGRWLGRRQTKLAEAQAAAE